MKLPKDTVLRMCHCHGAMRDELEVGQENLNAPQNLKSRSLNPDTSPAMIPGPFDHVLP
jgi:hypothetical protein